MNIYDIKSPEDIKGMSVPELKELADDIRKYLIDSISKTGGHLSSNLGIVELTIALHYVFDSPKDKIFFDVGHQAYVHKILTGRATKFPTLRQYKGLSGFQKRCESVHDVWEAGHSSTSLSAALGMAVARDLNHEDYHVIPVIGDASLASGMSMEALNQIGGLAPNMIIIFNDNNMSISQAVGAMDETFTRLRTSKPYNALKEDLRDVLSTSKTGKSLLETMRQVKNTVKENVVDTSIFGEYNLDYIGPVDGHNLNDLIKVLKTASKHHGPIVIHVMTKKGKGYRLAENDRDGKWHGVSQFDPATGQSLSRMPAGQLSWSEVMATALLQEAKYNEDIVAISPAMVGGSKLNEFFYQFPNRSFDCGIAEEHAMTFAASLALSGKKPFISIYSSFLQRAYDQVSHDVARMNLPVVIGIDRCGLVGEDGATHHGVFDISMLRSIPNLVLSQPKDAIEAQNLLHLAFMQNVGPFAIRYPRGNIPFTVVDQYEEIMVGSWTRWDYNDTSKVIVITYGVDVDKVISKAKVNEKEITVINARFFKPIDETMLQAMIDKNIPIIIYESDSLIGGLSDAILEYNNDHHANAYFERIGLSDHFVEQGSLPQLRKAEKIDTNTLFELIDRYL
ncbi:MAG: 1-deoxy-D-xylulose-5-phosphate synthase [Erysipelotrichaceae bacterium]